MFAKARSRMRAWRRRKQAQTSKETLREFVYLDDVSVYSLLASKLGPIASEFTSTETIGLTSDAGISSGIGVTGRAGVSSSVETSSQVVRKAIVQTAFRDLMAGVGPDISFVPKSARGQVDESAPTGRVAASDLVRGDLLEVEVTLEADPTYRLSTVISTVSDVIETFPGQLGSEAAAGYEIGVSVNKLLEQMMLGLVPLRCRVHGAWVDGDEVVLQGGDGRGPSLHVVGVTQLQKYWRDTRLVLFSGQRYRMLCRIASDGFVEDWKAIRGRESLGKVFPDLDGTLAYFETGALGDLTMHASGRSRGRKGVEAAEQYLHEIAAIAGELSPTVPPAFGTEALVDASVEVRRDAYAALENLAFGALLESVTAAQRASCRFNAYQVAIENSDPPTRRGEATRDGRMIEVEFVAIYW